MKEITISWEDQYNDMLDIFYASGVKNFHEIMSVYKDSVYAEHCLFGVNMGKITITFEDIPENELSELKAEIESSEDRE